MDVLAAAIGDALTDSSLSQPFTFWPVDTPAQVTPGRGVLRRPDRAGSFGIARPQLTAMSLRVSASLGVGLKHQIDIDGQRFSVVKIEAEPSGLTAVLSLQEVTKK